MLGGKTSPCQNSRVRFPFIMDLTELIPDHCRDVEIRVEVPKVQRCASLKHPEGNHS